MRVLLLVALVAGSLAAADDQWIPEHTSLFERAEGAAVPAHALRHDAAEKEELGMPELMHSRVSLVMRALDTDHDKLVDMTDVARNPSAFRFHFPGMTGKQFESFIELADQNGDKKLSEREMADALTVGMAHNLDASPSLLEAEAERRTGVKAQAKKGFLGGIVKGAVNNLKNMAGTALRTVTGQVDTRQDGCVMCQYIVERIEGNVRASGVIPGLSASFDGASLVEVESQTKDPYAAVGASIIGSTRQMTRYQRQMERQKFNEIYRVADITLDDVCEQGMPNSYYGYCKDVYKVQSDIVDGLRYQYRPSDVCFRVGMCTKSSYITKGIHSRYKF